MRFDIILYWDLDNFITQDNRKMAPALYLLYTYLGMGGLYTCIRRGIIVLLLGKGSPEPQYSNRRWFPRLNLNATVNHLYISAHL